MLCKVCNIESSKAYCTYNCEQHDKCLIKLASGTDDEKCLAQHAIQRHDILDVFPGIYDTFIAKEHTLDRERRELLEREKMLKRDGNKTELKETTKAKGDVNMKLRAYKACNAMLRCWHQYGMFPEHDAQCFMFRRWRTDVHRFKHDLDAEDRENMGEIIELAAPR